MANEEGTSDFSQVLDTLRQAADLWSKIYQKIIAAWRQSQKGLGDGEMWQAECLLGEFEEKITLVAQRAQLEAEQRPRERFYPWLEDVLLLQGRRPYHRIFTPQWYMDSADRGLEALKDSSSSAELFTEERQRLIERLEKASNTITEIIATLKNPPAKQRGRRKP